jgi:diguanylate cyclase (GGDEF)-like protein
MDGDSARMRVLLVGDGPAAIAQLPSEFAVVPAADPSAAVDAEVDCVLLAGAPDPLGAIVELRAAAPRAAVVLVADDEELALAALGAGAHAAPDRATLDGEGLGRAVRHAVARARVEARLAGQALHDPLTGLANRALFLDRCAQALARKRRRGGALALLFLDVDRFKGVNDAFGHEAGDRLLTALAERLRGTLRAGDTAARLGGDEFVVLCEEVRGVDHALSIAERLAAELHLAISVDGREVDATVSVGIAVANGPPTRTEELMRDADVAMYRAKRRGGGIAEVFDERLRERAQRRRGTADALSHAVERGELRLHHQPVHALDTGEVVAVEALLRWAHPERGLVAPAQFLPAAEETGLIVPLGAWAVAEACRQAARWDAARPRGRRIVVAVNLSPRQWAHPDLLPTVQTALRGSGIEPGRLRLEVAEAAVSADLEAALLPLEALRALGLSLALDDFGTGPSSLATLQRCPVDVVKVDGAVVGEIERDRRAASLVAAVVELAHALGLGAVAEGVEAVGQAERLRALGCDAAQGFLFARPQEAEGLGELLARSPTLAP